MMFVFNCSVASTDESDEIEVLDPMAEEILQREFDQLVMISQ